MAGYTDSVGCDVGWYWLASDCWSWNAGWHRIYHVVVHRHLAFGEAPVLETAKVGILVASVVSGIAGAIVLVKRR